LIGQAVLLRKSNKKHKRQILIIHSINIIFHNEDLTTPDIQAKEDRHSGVQMIIEI
jgi:hypothetical protein